MTEPEARLLQREIEGLLDGDEIGLLRAEESEHIPGYWGVTLSLTSMSDWFRLKKAILKGRGKYGFERLA